jgi:hypothetical protein
MQARFVSVIAVVATAAAFGMGAFVLGRTTSQSTDVETRQLLRRDLAQLEALRAMVQRQDGDRQPPRAIATIDEQSLAQLADLVASRLQPKAGSGVAGAGHEAPAVPSPPPVSTESKAALDKAHALLDGAIAGGVWRDQESKQFRQLLPQMDSSQSEEAVRKLVMAINDRAMAVRTSGPAF